jgi:predicted nucleotidyltransferase/predicted DNA-binding transcriptional regulator
MDKKISKAISKIKEHHVLVPYLGDYRARFHIREIARKMEMNHRTVGLALQRLENQDIMKHTVSGRNKVYYLNPENPRTKDFIRDAESFRLGNLLNIPIIKELYSSLMQPPFPYTPIIIFGSYAKSENTAKSDIDLAILGRNEKILESVKKFELKYNKKVHVHAYEQEEFERGIKEKEPLFLEMVANHVVLNSHDVFVSILWRHFYG